MLKCTEYFILLLFSSTTSPSHMYIQCTFYKTFLYVNSGIPVKWRSEFSEQDTETYFNNKSVTTTTQN